jgi:hypothetical protein
LVKLEQAWSDAIVKYDAKGLDLILAEEYTLTTPDGQRVTKEQLLEFLRRPRDASFVVKGVEEDDLEAQVYGNTAVLRFLIRFWP